jgi:hypothetical protein
MIAKPLYVALDTSILGKIAADFWSSSIALQANARHFVSELTNRGVYVVLSSTHVAELFRHRNIDVVRDRY